MAIEQNAQLPGTQADGTQPQTNAGQQQVNIEQTVFNGATFAQGPSVPSTAVAGSSFTVTGVMGFDCPICTFDRPVRVVAEIQPGATRTSDIARLNGRGETSQFSFSIPAPQETGQTVTVRLKAQHKEGGTWATNNTRGPFTVNIVSQARNVANQALGAAPWVVGGAGIGAGTALATNRGLLLPATTIGTSIGASAYAVSSADVLPRFTFPTEEVLVASVFLGTGGLLLSQLGIDEIAGAIEEGVQGVT